MRSAIAVFILAAVMATAEEVTFMEPTTSTTSTTSTSTTSTSTTTSTTLIEHTWTSTFNLGPITVNSLNGQVSIDGDADLDESSRLFWLGLHQHYPSMFSDPEIRVLAKSGRICGTMGHVWLQGANILGKMREPETYRTCATCRTVRKKRVAWE